VSRKTYALAEAPLTPLAPLDLTLETLALAEERALLALGLTPAIPDDAAEARDPTPEVAEAPTEAAAPVREAAIEVAPPARESTADVASPNADSADDPISPSTVDQFPYEVSRRERGTYRLRHQTRLHRYQYPPLQFQSHQCRPRWRGRKRFHHQSLLQFPLQFQIHHPAS
jgi:hypothetical protein